jgi:hypothetical protein
LFGKPTTGGSIFGQAATTATPGGGVFGSSAVPGTPPTSLFGKPASTAGVTGGGFGSGVFGQPASVTPAVSSPGSLFGQVPGLAASAAPATGLFGKPAAPSQSVFGAAGSSSQGLFGAGAAGSGSVQNDALLYTPLAELTASEKQQFLAKMFTLGKIPMRPPPKELIIDQ